MTTPITDARILELARRHQQYEAAGKVVTLRGPGILEFARALLAEQEGQRVDALTSLTPGPAPKFDDVHFAAVAVDGALKA